MAWTRVERCVRHIVAQNADRLDLVDEMRRIDGTHCGRFFHNHQVRFVHSGQRDDADDAGRDANALDVVDRG